jgi:hypothetical protein
MKGVIFTEFLEMVEQQFSIETADRIIEASDLSTDGAYTSVGTYDHAELLQLVSALSGETDLPVPDLVRGFGKHLFGRFHALYGQFFEGPHTTFSFLSSVHSYIHVEVRKLYADAELPTFDCEVGDDTHMVMIYRSKHPFSDLAEGLIAGCADHFGESIEIRQEDLSRGNRTHVRFQLTKLD